MKRKILWLGLSFLLVAALVLTACPAPGKPVVEKPVVEEPVVEKPVVEEPVVEPKPGEGMYFRLVTHGSPGDPFFAVFVKGMEDAAAELGATAVFDLAGGDLALQLTTFKEAVAGRPDGIAITIFDDIVWDKPVADALAAGIPVFAINCDDTQGAAGNARLGFIGQDDKRAGYIVARRLFVEGEKKGIDLTKAHVVMPVEVPGAVYGELRSAGVRDAMEEFGIISYEMLDASYEIGVVEARMAAYLIANPHTTFMITMGGMTTDRLHSSLVGAGLQPGEVLAGGFDTTAGTLEGIREGYVTATIDQQQYLQGYFAIYALYLQAKGYGFAFDLETGGLLVDSLEDVGLLEELVPLHIR